MNEWMNELFCENNKLIKKFVNCLTIENYFR